MAKAIGARCNMRCAYCYYLGKEALLGSSPGRMSEELLELYIGQRIEAADRGGRGSSVHFEWHGGEPTLLGLGYFKSIARLERKFRPDGAGVTNGLQTNGLVLNGAWAEFLAAERWSVGLSLDGPEEIHDQYRRSAEGGPTHERVLRSYERLREHGAFVNLLCVVTRESAPRPDETYGFFRGIGAKRLQFLPLVTPARRVPGARASLPHPLAATPEVIGDFLCRVFDLWIVSDVGRLVVQNFDEALRPIYGLPHALCLQRESCGNVAVLERDGSLSACDHFVEPEYCIGNIRERGLASLATDPALFAFGEEKRRSLPAACRECECLASCNGGCPKDRIAEAPGGDGLIDYLCPAYKRFFAHAQAKLEALATHMKSGKALKEFVSGSV